MKFQRPGQEKAQIQARWRQRLHEIIFEAETPAGKAFDVWLIICIMISVGVVLLESIYEVRLLYGNILIGLEWFFTILFTVEYLLRLISIGRPMSYATSFYGTVDFLAIVPTYISILIPGAQVLTVIRSLRILRVFRILKLVSYISEASQLASALRASRRKITVFLYFVSTLVIIIGSLMYVIEGAENGFSSIPQGIYWAIVTLTTVGYGDIAPATGFGKALASLVMILGYGIIAVPTGIVTSELNRIEARAVNTISCPSCAAEGHDTNATYCKFCGAKL